jgi:hypothetical protein
MNEVALGRNDSRTLSGQFLLRASRLRRAAGCSPAANDDGSLAERRLRRAGILAACDVPTRLRRLIDPCDADWYQLHRRSPAALRLRGEGCRARICVTVVPPEFDVVRACRRWPPTQNHEGVDHLRKPDRIVTIKCGVVIGKYQRSTDNSIEALISAFNFNLVASEPLSYLRRRERRICLGPRVVAG